MKKEITVCDKCEAKEKNKWKEWTMRDEKAFRLGVKAVLTQIKKQVLNEKQY